MDGKSAPDARIAAVAVRQHGVVSTEQLREVGFSETMVLKRCRAGRLHRIHRGVYAVGHRGLTAEGRWMAAALALGGDAVVSHRSAAALWGLLPTPEGPVDLSLPSRNGRRKRQGIRIHRPMSLAPGEQTRQRGIPVTSPARTIVDLGSVVTARELRQAIRQADALGLPVGADITHDRTRSELEHRFLGLCRRYRLPTPAVNMRIGGLTVDFCWVEQRLVVETDGYRYHRGRAAFEDDRARDLRLRALGYEVVRLSYRQVCDESAVVAPVLHAALERDGAR
jgi:very-short-patch-repair endonuclease